MFNWILRRAIGGESGKREIGLLILLYWFLFTTGLAVLDGYDIEAEMAQSMWNVFTPFAFGSIAGAFGLEWYGRIKSGESK